MILVEVGQLEAYLLCRTDLTGIVEVLAKNACDREWHRRFVFVKTKEGHLVADVEQHAIMRDRMDLDYQELQEIVECMNMQQKRLLTTMERKQKLDERSTGENSGENFIRKSWSQRTGLRSDQQACDSPS